MNKYVAEFLGTIFFLYVILATGKPIPIGLALFCFKMETGSTTIGRWESTWSLQNCLANITWMTSSNNNFIYPAKTKPHPIPNTMWQWVCIWHVINWCSRSSQTYNNHMLLNIKHFTTSSGCGLRSSKQDGVSISQLGNTICGKSRRETNLFEWHTSGLEAEAAIAESSSSKGLEKAFQSHKPWCVSRAGSGFDKGSCESWSAPQSLLGSPTNSRGSRW